MAKDCTAEFNVMKLPRLRGSADAPMSAMPGIMRPLITTNKIEDTTSTPAMGKSADKVMASNGSGMRTANRRNA